MWSPETILRNETTGRVRAGWRLLVGLVVGLVGVALAGQIANQLLDLPASTLAAQLAAVGITLAIVVSLTRVDDRPFSDYGFGLDDGWLRDLGFGFAVGAAVTVVSFAVLLAAGWATVDGWLVAGENSSFLVGFVVFALSFCCVGLWEEGFFRGFLLTTVAEALPVAERTALWASTLVTGAFFGVLHLSQSGVSLAILFWVELGVVLGAIYVLTGRIWLAVGFHAAIDVFANLGVARYGESPAPALVGADVTGPEWAVGLAGAVNVVVVSLGAVALLWWARRSGTSLLADDSRVDASESSLAD